MRATVMGHRFNVGEEVTMGPTTPYNGSKAIIKRQLPGISLPNYLVVLKLSNALAWAVETDFVEARSKRCGGCTEQHQTVL